MAEFFNTNKRNALAEAVLPLLGAATALATVAMVMPTGLASQLVSGVAALMGRSDKKAFAELLSSIRAAKKDEATSWTSSFADGKVGAGSSIEMITGRTADFSATDFSAKLGANKTVRGIYTPEDARKKDGAIAFEPGETDFFSGGASASTGDHMKAALETIEVPPPNEKSAGRSPGRIPKRTALALDAAGVSQINRNSVEGLNKPFTQLAQARTMSLASRSANTREYAAAASGAVYDGRGFSQGRLVKETASLPVVDGKSIPRIPDGYEAKLKTPSPDLSSKPVHRKRRAVYSRHSQ